MTTEEPEVGFERLRQPARLIAAQEIAAAEHEWSIARSRHEVFNDIDSLSERRKIARIALLNSFYDLTDNAVTPEDASSVLDLFVQTAKVPNATLGRIEMKGDWTAATPFEANILPMMAELYKAGYKQIAMLPSDAPDPKRGIMIPAGLTNEKGFVALQRKRRLLVAQLTDPPRKGPHPPAQLEIDKVSTFALDIEQLARLDQHAAREVRLIVLMTMYNACDWGALDNTGFVERQTYEDRGEAVEAALREAKTLRDAMQRNNITIDQILERAASEKAAHLHKPASIAYVESAIRERHAVLTPAATTYYVHR